MKRITGKKPKIEKKKIKISKKLIILILLVIIVLAFIVVRLLPSIKSIEIDLNSLEGKITKEDVQTISGLKIGDRLYKEKRSVIEKRIEENPYIEKAEINRELSGKVKINIIR